MRITRLYIPSLWSVGDLVALPPEKSHHLVTVLRATVGDPVILFNGDGHEYLGVIHTLQKKNVCVQIQTLTTPHPEPSLNIHLGQGLCRGEKMDWVIQKAVELGVAAITPLFTEHSNVKLEAERLDKKQQHWQQVMISACEQSGRTHLPLLHPPQTLPLWVQHTHHAHKYLLHPTIVTEPFTPQPAPTTIVLLIGPEGGFSPMEVSIAQQQGFQGIQLGNRILRTETAPIAALSWLQTLYGDFPR